MIIVRHPLSEGTCLVSSDHQLECSALVFFLTTQLRLSSAGPEMRGPHISQRRGSSVSPPSRCGIRLFEHLLIVVFIAYFFSRMP
jgi:hypothetical protein